jgi:hypothetical protein
LDAKAIRQGYQRLEGKEIQAAAHKGGDARLGYPKRARGLCLTESTTGYFRNQLVGDRGAKLEMGGLGRGLDGIPD